jgi:hypothetical protein
MNPDARPPGFDALREVMPGLEEALGVIMVPTLGIPVRPNPLNQLFPHVKRVLDGHRDIIRAHAEQVTPYIFSPMLESIPEDKVDEVTPYWGNAYFPHGDARLAYAVIARHRPRRIVEIGCGNSTKFMRRAAQDHGIATRIVCVDPQPREEIGRVADEVVLKELQGADTEIFAELEGGDIVFVDSSHLVLNGSDCTHFFLNVMPVLAPGVWVHLHDIFLPHDYPYQQFVDWRSNEQYMLAVLLLFSREWIPVLPIYYGYHEGLLPHGGGSFWMKREA